MTTQNRVIEFFIDDVDDVVSFEGCDDTYFTEEFMTHLMNKVRVTDWFLEGNKTEGSITFHSLTEFTIEWVVKTMGEDWDSDEEEEHSQDVLLNMDTSQYKVVNW